MKRTSRSRRHRAGAHHKSAWGLEEQQRAAAATLEREHGISHDPGARTDLCPLCQADDDHDINPLEMHP